MAREKILVVDDEDKIIRVLRACLEKGGYQVVEAYDGRQALEMGRKEHPDLVILDLMLPDVSGWDVCRTLRQESNIPGTISVSIGTTASGRALLSVADTGLGIGPDDLPHLFDRFYRADHSRTRKSGGSGLGLVFGRGAMGRQRGPQDGTGFGPRGFGR